MHSLRTRLALFSLLNLKAFSKNMCPCMCKGIQQTGFIIIINLFLLVLWRNVYCMFFTKMTINWDEHFNCSLIVNIEVTFFYLFFLKISRSSTDERMCFSSDWFTCPPMFLEILGKRNVIATDTYSGLPGNCKSVLHRMQAQCWKAGKLEENSETNSQQRISVSWFYEILRCSPSWHKRWKNVYS